MFYEYMKKLFFESKSLNLFYVQNWSQFIIFYNFFEPLLTKICANVNGSNFLTNTNEKVAKII